MSESGSTGDGLGPVIESFLARCRRGERPSVDEYAARHPALAGRIRELLAVLVAIERVGDPPGAGGEVHPFATAAPPRAADLPERLGDYRILRLIGQGGMGVVYEARRELLQSRVALKVMQPRFRGDDSYLRRFRTEARSAAGLHHTNIVPVFDFGEHDGVCYYAMQYIAGVSLNAVLRDVRRLRGAMGTDPSGTAAGADRRSTQAVEGPLSAVSRGLLSGRFATPTAADGGPEPPPTVALTPEPVSPAESAPERVADPPASPDADSDTSSGSHSFTGQPGSIYFREIARLGAQIADALDYAHRQHIVHRDIKPANLLLDAQGNAWVTDFGLAKLVEGEDLSQSHDLVGTLRFMAPERFRGITDRRGDIYALGATLYEMLALRPVFPERDQIRLIEQIAHQPPVPLRQHDRRIPRDLETIVHKVLSKDPKDRCEKAGELRDELRRFLDGRPTRWRRVGPVERFRRWCRRNAWLAAASIAAAVLTAVLAIGSTVAAWIYRDQRNEIGRSLGQTQQAEHQARLALGQSFLSEGAALQRTGLIGQRFDSLDRLRRAAQILGADPQGQKRMPEIRNQAIAALGLTDLRPRRQHDNAHIFLGIDPASGRYASMGRSGAIVVRRADDDRELARLPGPDQFAFSHATQTFSPDGELLAAHYFGHGADLLRIWHLGAPELLGSLPKRHGDTTPLFHPDGRSLLFDAPEGGIAFWDRFERRVVRRLSLDFTPAYLALDPEGRRIAVNSIDRAAPRLAIIELETGRVLDDWRSQVGNGALAWSADGQLLAVGGAEINPDIFVWNVRRRALESVLQGHNNLIIAAQFAHSGYLLATASWDGTTRLWDAASGESLLMAPGGFFGFSPGDHRLALADGEKFGIWDLAAAPECRTLHPGMRGNRTERRNENFERSADVSPDGRLVATREEGGVRLWEADSGRELAHLNTGYCETVLFHPDGQHLISSSRWGLYRWPIRPDHDRGPDAIVIGPPNLLREAAGTQWSCATWMPDHRTLALIDNASARVLLVDSGHPHPPRSRASALDSGENRRMTSVAVSPDGRWLAVGGWKEAGVRVWDLRRRRLERVLRPNDTDGDQTFHVGFSPDGLWLVSSTSSLVNSYHFWHVGTWELGRRIVEERGAIAWHRPVFTRDGRYMALGISPDQVLLADAATGRELARLTTLQPVTPTPLVFSPDGTTLVAGTTQRTALIWDLRPIRDHLGPMGLDWDAPPFPVGPDAREAAGPLPPPRPVRVVGEVIEPQARRAGELAAMNRRIAANPDDAEALIHRGWLFTREKKWPAAIADLERSLRLRPDAADACWLLAEAYQETGNLAGALAAFGRRLERAPEDCDARFWRGLLALALAQPDLAVDDFTRILTAEPDLERARYRRAQALTRLGRHREALADLDILIPKASQDDAPYLLRGTVREALGDSDKARADREKASALLPRHPTALNNRAWVLATGSIDQRDPDRALVLARQAVALAPGQQVSLNTLGVALYRAGQDAEAVSILERSLAAGKGQYDAFDLFFLAMAHHRLGHREEAHTCFDRAVRWWDERKNLPAQYVSELTSFRAEAEAVLGRGGPSAELPADVFAPE